MRIPFFRWKRPAFQGRQFPKKPVPKQQPRKPAERERRKTPRPPKGQELHPRPVQYGYQRIGYGNEAALYRIPERRVVHKFWRQEWILAHYPMFDSRGRLFRQMVRRAEGRINPSQSAIFQHDTQHQGPQRIYHGLPVEQFGRITWILSRFSQDLLDQARRNGIPTPRIARTVSHPTKPGMYVLELSDLSKPKHTIASIHELPEIAHAHPVDNLPEIMRGIQEDKRVLRRLGYEEDRAEHAPGSAWIVRINDRTHRAERFLWDVTNLRQTRPE